MIEVADLQPGQRVLDVGCGSGPLAEKLAEVARSSATPREVSSSPRGPGT
jgi:cyclopropane fatty-acyl-phospholipid synthase-like methyltransferase